MVCRREMVPDSSGAKTCEELVKKEQLIMSSQCNKEKARRFSHNFHYICFLVFFL
jgi:hypothetical protein